MIGIVVATDAAPSPPASRPSSRQGEFIVPLPYVIWFYLLTQAPDSFAYRLMTVKPFRWLGDLSFGVYLFHKPVFYFYAFARLGISGMRELVHDDFLNLDNAPTGTSYGTAGSRLISPPCRGD